MTTRRHKENSALDISTSRHLGMSRVIMALLTALLLLAGGAMNEAWAARVTYHILTLPINPSEYDYHMKSGVTGYRLEALKIVVDGTTVELPAHYKSPLATGFTYYETKDIEGHGGSAVSLYDGVASRKGVLYRVEGEETPADDSDDATPVAEGTPISTSTAEYYVVYTYNSSNTIAKLDGSVNYNIGVKGKGFLSLNRGRNNRPAVIPTAKVDPEMLASWDFSYVDNPGNNIGTYWNDGNNKNTRDSTESKFFFIFKFEGKDPYHIVLRTSYARNYTFIEKNEDGDKAFVYKWYKGAALMAKGTGNAYLASDDHVRYKTEYNALSPNPQDPASDAKTAYFHGNDQTWGTLALLNNTSNNGYVFMGTRTVDGNGATPTPSNNKYYYLTFNGYNNLNFSQIDATSATNNQSMDGIYPLKKVTFKVATPFYKVEATDAHIVSVEDWVSQYTVDNDRIEAKYLPAALRRKYCSFTDKYYKDAACTQQITKFSEADYDNTEGYKVYLGYQVSAGIPFQAITPKSSYTDAELDAASWYELTDDGSTQAEGKKIEYDGAKFMNNGDAGVYGKTAEYAFIGDPYELRVLLRSATVATTPHTLTYVGAAGTPTSPTDLTASTSVTAGYKWELPYDAPVGSFLLKKYKGDGYWLWQTDHVSAAINHTVKSGQTVSLSNSEAQTFTLNISNFTGGDGHYFKLTSSDADHISGSDPTLGTGKGAITGTTGTATVTVKMNTSGAPKSFTLSIQEYDINDAAQGAETVITVNQGTTPYAGHAVTYSTDGSTRVKVMNLPKVNFTYNIVDYTHGDIAIQATVEQTIFTPIAGFASIPADIRSPFLADETITYWRTYSAGTCSNQIYETSNTDGDNIYVKYTLDYLSEKSIKLNDSQQFKVKLNDEYIYYDSDASKILSTPGVDADAKYSWSLEGGDPYAMKIKNVGNSNKYVKVHEGTWGDDTALDFIDGIENGSRFIAMLSLYSGIYEVLAATGTTYYYHIGRPSSEGAETKVYSTSTYAHGANQLRFELEGVDPITYHLIDKTNTELLSVTSFNPRLTLPADYQSPLVEEYYYYPTRAKATSDLEGDRITEIKDDTEEDNTTPGDNHVYVTYKVNNVVKFNTGQYMLKFLDPDPDGYYLEDGNDKLTTTKKQPVYPYCNGDGNLNVYDDKMQKEQFNGGASTRPRWVWYFESELSDPYHVRIHSRSTVSYKSVAHNTYLTTYVVHFKQDPDPNTKHVVTGGTLPGAASETPMEYMVLGTFGNYKLLTTQEIDDGTTTERRKVTSLEQYWKTYNMIKLHLLGISKSTNAYSDDPTTWVVPDDKRDDLDDALEEKGIGRGNWHSYNAYANATRWNGYNDKTNGEEKKVVEKLEHWYQSFDMGDGTFDIENAEVAPVLVLLDRHGWEIMRKPLPTTTYPEGDDELAALRVYDSPLVDRYYFYSNATKASGCHKYTLRMQDDKERDQIKVNGEHYSSTSLGDLPPLTATGVVSGGVLNDQYVTYTVKEEYECNYAYHLDESTSPYTESGVSQPYLVLQHGRFYKTENSKSPNPSYISKPIIEHTTPEGGNVYDMIVSPHNHGGTNDNIIDDGSGNWIGNNFWYVKPNLNIDDEMGIPWIMVTGEETETAAKNKLRKEYEKKTGFDPYNIQLQLKNKNDGTADGRYLTSHMTSSRVSNGIMIGNYSGSGGSTYVTLEDEGSVTASGEGYDHTTLHISNQTFMAVSDVNGNMQLMPRFDHTLRVDLEGSNPWETKLLAPVNHAKANLEDNSSQGRQTTFFVRPQRFKYHIIDNYGREALIYLRPADFYPAITEHFKSPIAKDFTYYSGLAESNSPAASTPGAWDSATGEFKRTLTKASMLADAVKILPTAGTYQFRIGTRGAFSYQSVEVTKGFSEKQITGSFAAMDVDDLDANVYVRYDYDEDADLDADRLLQGQWFTAKLAAKDMQAIGEVMKYTRTVPNDGAYTAAKAALSSDGDYYFRIGTGVGPTPYTAYKKVNVDGETKTETPSDVEEWTSALDIAGLGVDIYMGSDDSRSQTATSYNGLGDDNSLVAKANKLTATGYYYFRVGEKPSYTYYKVIVTTAYDGETDATYTDDLDDGSKGYDTKWSNSKPLVVDADAKKWQWKLLAAPTDPSSDYYVAPDPYAIQLFNRHSNYTTNPSLEPSPMAVGIKVPNSETGADRFALLSHPDGGYALVVAKTYSTYEYPFLNGADMTLPTTTAATTANEASFTYKSGVITPGAQLQVDEDVTYNFTYYVITSDTIVAGVNVGNKLAITATQTSAEAESHAFAPYLPESAQTPLLNMDDYRYYGFARPVSDRYEVIEQTILYTLSGLYDDDVYVRYNKYNMDRTSFKVPNKRNETGTGQVARDPGSVDVSMNINGELPYNIIWYNDNIMQSTDGTAISGGGSHDLSGDGDFVWYFTGNNDPYALKIKHKGGKYLNGTTTMVAEADAMQFMLLKKDGYDYGILQETGGDDRLSGYGQTTVTGDPTKFIIFGLSIHDLIYRLIIARTCTEAEKADPDDDQYVDIPYMTAVSGTPETKRIYGSTQRDLKSIADESSPKKMPGDKYQLGETLAWYDLVEEDVIYHTYCYDAGSVSIGDDLMLPNIFSRPNCTFEFYIEGIYQHYSTPNPNEGKPYTTLDIKYKGLKLNKLMTDDELINQNVVVNIVYSFNQELATNNGMDFVRSTEDKCWYTFETSGGGTPYLAHYTNAWGLQAMEGRDTRYTNDYLWTPLGDVYGFKMYNRYMLKNSKDGDKKVMTMSAISEGQNLLLAEPSTTENPTAYPAGNEIFELVSGDAEGYFRVHPVVNTGATRYYVRRDPSDSYAKLSTTPCDWTFGLSMDLMAPYYERAGYVGGLTPAGKTAYETAVASGTIMDIQHVVYDDANIIPYEPGYYRMYNQPGVSGIDPVRYASGYLHKVELTGDGVHTAGPIPMHFYSKVGTAVTFAGGEDALESGFTITNATRGEVPIDPVEVNPSTIFYFEGNTKYEGNPRSTIQTQGLYIASDANGDADSGTTTNRQQRAVMSESSGITFSLMDIGGAVLLIHDGADPPTRRYLNYDQSNYFQRTATTDEDMNTQADKFTSKGTYYFKIGGSTYKKLEVTTAYNVNNPETPATHSAAESSSEDEWNKAADKYDLKYYHDSPTDDAKWCLQPVQKSSTLGNGEMSLQIATNQGGDGYYYATFYAPFDVLLPADGGGHTYNAYTCKKWYNTGVNPVVVPAVSPYAEGKLIPAATPVIIRTNDESDVLDLALPNSSPSSPLSCVFKGVYLEQKLAAADPVRDVYTLGVPYISEIHKKEEDYSTTGEIIAPTPEFATSGVGFYINATADKESEPQQSLWKRNNLYVLHNKIYYRADPPGSPGAREVVTRSAVNFVPLIFGDERIEQPDVQPDEEGGFEESLESLSDQPIFDLAGRRLSEKPAKGFYIQGGKKFFVR